jgi:protoporphyrinogen oxidase
MKKIIILGAGVTGLSSGWKLSEKGFDVTIIEKDSEVGGLAKTINFNNNLVDLGPHSFFSEDKEVYDTVVNLFKDEPQNMPVVKRSVKMFFMNYYVDYPLSAKSILFQMGPIIPIKSFLSFLNSFIKSFFKKKNKNDNLSIEEWAIENFGFFLYKNFFKPYTEQFWKISTENLSHRVIPASKKLDFAKTLKHLFVNKYLEISKREPGSLNLVQRESLPTFYPKKGFGEITKKILNKVTENKGRIRLNETVKLVNCLKNGKFSVETDKQNYDADIVISTLPLDSFVKSLSPLNKNKEIINSSKKLNYLALKIVYLLVKKKNVLGCQYCYFIDRPYNRVSNLNLFSNELTNSENEALSVEISCHKNSEIWNSSDEQIYKLCADSLIKDNIISQDDILEWKVINVPNVYPIYQINYESHLNKVRKELDKINNLYSLGRLGKFYYGDIDQMIRFGFNIAKKID